MFAINRKFLPSAVVIAVSCVVLGAASASAAPPVTSLLTLDQQALDTQAVTLLNEPAVKAARDAVLKSWSEHSPYGSKDGKAALPSAIDEVVYHSLRAAIANDPTQPKVAWTLAPGYKLGKITVPGSRFAGDNTDRIYRYVAVNPAYKYEVRGKRGAHPAQHEFSFEASGSMSIALPPAVTLFSRDVDVAADGSFVVKMDSEPTAEGQRNHLTLPPGMAAVLFRDTLPDWATDYNSLTVVRVDGEAPRAARSREELVADAVRIIGESAKGGMPVFDISWKHDANTLNPFVRPQKWGVPGNVLGMDRYQLQADEALVFTLLPSGANYMGVEVMDAWGRSVNYWNRVSSLTHLQAKPNADGSFTFVVSAKDPGIYNWLDNTGLVDGMILTRWELFANPLPPGDAPQLVRDIRKVKMSDLASALPKDMARITTAERKKQLKARATDYGRRVALK